MSKTIKSYKGMDKNMQCKGFQYEVGKTYETDKAVVCQCGFHACEAPLNVWDYYPPIDGNRFFEVEQSGKLSKHTGDSKVASTKLKVGAEIGIPGLVKAHVEWVKEQVKDATDAAQIGSSGRYAKIGSSGDAAQIGSSGDDAQIGSSGDAAKIGSSGDDAKIGSSGRYAKIGSSGYAAQIGSSGYAAQIGSSGDAAKIGSSGRYAKIGSSGDDAQIGSSGDAAQIGSSGYAAQIGSSGDAAKIGSSGDDAKIGSSGDDAKIGSSGRYAKIGSSGRYAKVVCEAENAVVACVGIHGKIKAPIGTWITLAEYGEWDGEGYPCICVKSARIDGDVLKPNVFYTLRNGEFVEVSDE